MLRKPLAAAVAAQIRVNKVGAKDNSKGRSDSTKVAAKAANRALGITKSRRVGEVEMMPRQC